MLAYWAIQWRAARVSGLIFFRRAGRKRGIVWLGPPGTNTAARTRWQCKNGHLWVTTLAAIVNEHECPRCLGRAQKTRSTLAGYAPAQDRVSWSRTAQEHNDQDALRMCAANAGGSTFAPFNRDPGVRSAPERSWPGVPGSRSTKARRSRFAVATRIPSSRRLPITRLGM